MATTFGNVRAFFHLKKLLARAQRQWSKKQKGSKRSEKAKLRVQRIFKRIADLRANATHHVSSYIAKNYSCAVIEDLNINGMAKNRHLSTAIMDANMAELHRQLKYKMEWNGGVVEQVGPRFPSSKLCSACGTKNEALTLKDREWTCEHCGAHHDRDLNAAINLALEGSGRRLAVTARGGPGAARPTNEP